MGTIVAKTSQPRKRISRLREQTDILVRGVKKLGGDAWLAWDHAIGRGMTFGTQCFDWITIFDTVREIAAARTDDIR